MARRGPGNRHRDHPRIDPPDDLDVLVQGAQGAQLFAEAHLPFAVQASDVKVVGLAVSTDGVGGPGTNPALLIVFTDPGVAGDRPVVPPVLILDPKAGMVELFRSAIDLANEGHRQQVEAGVSVEQSQADRHAEIHECRGCGVRIFGDRIDVGLCMPCEAAQ